jgi:hypothetical protein
VAGRCDAGDYFGKPFMMVIIAGPRMTMKSVGKMKSTSGKSIFTGAL